MKKLSILIVFSLGIVLFSACDKKDKTHKENVQTAFHQEFDSYDMEGNVYPQKLDKVPERIVVNNLSCTEILLELGLKDKIVGILALDNKPNGKWEKELSELKVIGDKMKTNKEIIASYQPDIFIGSGRGLNEAYQGTINSYNQLGIPVYSQRASINRNSPTLLTIIEDVKNLGKILNVEDKANLYADQLQKKYNDILVKVKNVNNTGEPYSVLVIYSVDINKKRFSAPVISDGLQYDLISTLNLKPAIQGFSNDNTFEHLVKVNPDVIINIVAGRNYVPGEEVLKILYNDSMIKDVSAIKNKRVISINYDDLLDYGPRNFDTLEVLYNDIYKK